jgi:hypothetical protein
LAQKRGQQRDGELLERCSGVRSGDGVGGIHRVAAARLRNLFTVLQSKAMFQK